MQTYDYKFDPAISQTSTLFMADADLFVYESGKATVDGANTAVYVKPDNGMEIRLKPGQRFRLSDESNAKMWAVRLADPTVTLQAAFIIGSGEFDDANTLNKFTLDATLTNSVNVNNTVGAPANTFVTNSTANRVPVTLDPAQVLNTANSVMAYTTSHASTNATIAGVAGTPIQLLAAGTNVNGAVLNKFDYITNGAGSIHFTVLAKATAPASVTDGDVLFTGYVINGVQMISMDISKNGQPKVAAGKGIWLYAASADGAILRDALFTVL